MKLQRLRGGQAGHLLLFFTRDYIALAYAGGVGCVCWHKGDISAPVPMHGQIWLDATSVGIPAPAQVCTGADPEASVRQQSERRGGAA